MHVDDRGEARVGNCQFLDSEAVLDESGARAAVRLRRKHAEEAQFRDSVELVSRPRVSAVALGCGLGDDLCCDGARGIADHHFLFAQECC